MEGGAYSIDVVRPDGSTTHWGLIGHPSGMPLSRILAELEATFGFQGDLCINREGRRYKLLLGDNHLLPLGRYTYKYVAASVPAETEASDVERILHSCPLLAIPENTERSLSAQTIQDYLEDTSGLQLPGVHPHRHGQANFFPSSSLLAVAFTHLAFNGEAVDANSFLFPWQVLKRNAPMDMGLKFDVTYGSYRVHSGLDGFSHFEGGEFPTFRRYGFPKVDIFISYIVNDDILQLFMEHAASKSSASESISRKFNLNKTEDRVNLALVFVKLYFLLLSFQRIGLSDIRRSYLPPALIKIKYAGGCGGIRITDKCVQKTIGAWGRYAQAHDIQFEDVKAAYECHDGSQGHLPSGAPRLDEDHLRYEVELKPVGLLVRDPIIQTEDDLRLLALHVLYALRALHRKGLVHRDIRLANVIYHLEERKFVLIDLEHASKSGKRPIKKLSEWTFSTLKEGMYTFASDLHQLGSLLEKLRLHTASQCCKCFVEALLDAQDGLTAEEMIGHDWFKGWQDGDHCLRYPFQL